MVHATIFTIFYTHYSYHIMMIISKKLWWKLREGFKKTYFLHTHPQSSDLPPVQQKPVFSRHRKQCMFFLLLFLYMHIKRRGLTRPPPPFANISANFFISLTPSLIVLFCCFLENKLYSLTNVCFTDKPDESLSQSRNILFQNKIQE